MMNDSTRIMRPAMAGTAARSANRGRHHRHGRPGHADGGMQRQPVIYRFRRLVECGRVSELRDRCQLRQLHALPRGAKDPDPDSSNELANGLPKVSLQQLGVSSSRTHSWNACERLLPNGAKTPAQSQQDLNAMRRYARCMRFHGVPTWPDPTYAPAAFTLVHVHWGFNLVVCTASTQIRRRSKTRWTDATAGCPQA